MAAHVAHVTDLTREQRHAARLRATQASMLLLHHPRQVHYSQGPDRWDGIIHKLDSTKGEYPRKLDCSAAVSWALYNALHLLFGLPDTVNGENWLGGWTKTLHEHGRLVAKHPKGVPHGIVTLRADVALYGSPPDFEHAAMIVAHDHADIPMVMSQGSEPGPFYLPYNYRDDVGEIRRYIYKKEDHRR